MLLLLGTPFKWQRTEGSFQVTELTSCDHCQAADLLQNLKYCQGQINVSDNSQNNLALHNRYNVV